MCEWEQTCCGVGELSPSLHSKDCLCTQIDAWSDTRLFVNTGLSIIQVTSWFIKSRERGWKPPIHQITDHAELNRFSRPALAERLQA